MNWRRLPRPSLLEWLLLIVGAALTLRQAWLLDDAFIYFRYADNLLFLNRGLTYNAGEYVEGFSSPIWMLHCVVARSIGLDWWWIVRGTGLVAWCTCAILLIATQRRLHPQSLAGANLPLAFLALSYPTLCYWTSGLEAPLVQLAAPLVALTILNPASRALQAILGLILLVRHELVLSWLVCLVWGVIRTRRVPWTMLGSAAALVLGWLVFRVIYYAELLPNTYYLKDSENVAQGLRYVLQTVRAYQLAPLAAVVVAAAVVAWRRTDSIPRLRERIMMLLCALLQAAYVVRVGGDMMHHRFLVFSFVLVALSTAGILESLWGKARISRRTTMDMTAAVGCALLSALLYPPHLESNPLWGPTGPVNAPPVLIDGTNDAMSHRRHEDLHLPVLTLKPQLDLREQYVAYRAKHADGRHERVSGEGWCYDAFYAFDTQIVHRWGLTDPILARLALPWARPGHREGLQTYAVQLMYHRQFALSGERELQFRAAQAKRQRIPEWIARNLETIELIERKMYNQHRLRENLALAMQFAGRYSPGP